MANEVNFDILCTRLLLYQGRENLYHHSIQNFGCLAFWGSLQHSTNPLAGFGWGRGSLGREGAKRNGSKGKGKGVSLDIVNIPISLSPSYAPVHSVKSN